MEQDLLRTPATPIGRVRRDGQDLPDRPAAKTRRVKPQTHGIGARYDNRWHGYSFLSLRCFYRCSVEKAQNIERSEPFEICEFG